MTSLNSPNLRDPRVMQDLITHNEAELRTTVDMPSLESANVGFNAFAPTINDDNLDRDHVAQRYNVVVPDSSTSLANALTDDSDKEHLDARLHFSDGYVRELRDYLQPDYYEAIRNTENTLHNINLSLDLLSDSVLWAERTIKQEDTAIQTTLNYLKAYTSIRVQDVIKDIIEHRKSKEFLSQEFQYDDEVVNKNQVVNSFRSLQSSEIKGIAFKIFQKRANEGVLSDDIVDLAYNYNKLNLNDVSFDNIAIPQVGRIEDVDKFVESLPSLIKTWEGPQKCGVIDMLKLALDITSTDKNDRARILIIALTSIANRMGTKADENQDYLKASEFYAKQFKINEMIKVLKNTLPKESSQVAQ